ncbi:helicase associated domain-containing protein [Streptomyces clavifer]|uniref:helicase associated domain-containing protein n=1 Tax=Streptomyces clavifer TaxID=68188 RepID=UPI0033284988
MSAFTSIRGMKADVVLDEGRKIPADGNCNIKGFVCRAQAWDRGYRTAAGYFRMDGDLEVPRLHSAAGLRLDAWLARQRTARRNGRLTESGIDGPRKPSRLPGPRRLRAP